MGESQGKATRNVAPWRLGEEVDFGSRACPHKKQSRKRVHLLEPLPTSLLNFFMYAAQSRDGAFILSRGVL